MYLLVIHSRLSEISAVSFFHLLIPRLVPSGADLKLHIFEQGCCNLDPCKIYKFLYLFLVNNNALFI